MIRTIRDWVVPLSLILLLGACSALREKSTKTTVEPDGTTTVEETSTVKVNFLTGELTVKGQVGSVDLSVTYTMKDGSTQTTTVKPGETVTIPENIARIDIEEVSPKPKSGGGSTKRTAFGKIRAFERPWVHLCNQPTAENVWDRRFSFSVVADEPEPGQRIPRRNDVVQAGREARAHFNLFGTSAPMMAVPQGMTLYVNEILEIQNDVGAGRVLLHFYDTREITELGLELTVTGGGSTIQRTYDMDTPGVAAEWTGTGWFRVTFPVPYSVVNPTTSGLVIDSVSTITREGTSRPGGYARSIQLQ